MYHQFFRRTHGFLLRCLPRFPKSLSPTSQFHYSNKTLVSDSKWAFVLREVEELQSLKPHLEDKGREGVRGGDDEEEEEISDRFGFSELSPVVEQKVNISHPWPEWVDLMEHLLKKGYFESNGSPFDQNEMGKDSNRIRTACLNFGRDRFDLIRYFSRQDIRVIVGSGCPSLDRKVVNSGKRLRAHVGIDEGNVCSSCSLRGNCERAYVKAREDEGGRTVDLMRFLLTYGLEPITSSVENKLSPNKGVKQSVRRLLMEMVEFSAKELDSNPLKAIPKKRVPAIPEPSIRQQAIPIDVPMKQGDWVCPKCNFVNFAKNIKCLRCDGFFQERLRKLRENQDHLPLKKGDWLCDTCNFLNFAKNTRCLQCKEKPSKRQINPGEWECESCNYINFKRNMVCLKCDWKRPKASSYPGTSVEASKYSCRSAQPEHEDGGFRQPYAMKFVRDDEEATSRFSVRQDRQIRNKAIEVSSCVEDDGVENVRSPSERFSELDDFPILGGKTTVSQDPQARDKWKREMSKMRVVSKEKENHSQFPKKLKFLGSAADDDDDGEMAEWFGHGKKIETEKLETQPRHLDND